MFEYEEKLIKKGYKLIAGLDEAGRGCWAGPLVVGICILPIDYKNDDIDDSKKLNIKKRHDLFKTITESAIYWNYLIIPPNVVDKLNPKQASIVAMERLINEANNKKKIDFALIDAEKINTKTPSISIIKGDQLSQSIAAASIIAKTIRDLEMDKIHDLWPEYGFNKHQGYGTKLHQEKLKKLGPILGVHRFSYKPIKELNSRAK